MRTLQTLCVAVLLVAAATRTLAQERVAGRPDVPATQPSGDDRREDLKQMLLDRPEVPITRPLGDSLRTAGRAVMPRDGSFSEDRLCRIHRDPASGWVLIVFIDATPEAPEGPRWGLPNRMLQTLEEIAAANPDASFRLSGENTVYDGRAFLMVQRASIVPNLLPAPVPVVQPAPASQPAMAPTTAPATHPATPAATTQATGRAASAPATQPASGPAPKALPSGPSPEELIQRLRRDVPGTPVLEGTAAGGPRPQEPSVAPVGSEQVVEELRGTFVVDRLVTVVPAGKGRWLVARFASDNTLREPPLRLLPCRMLRQAELDVAASYKGRTLRLRISGLITRYKGQRFLLLRKAVVEHPMDRF